MCKVYNSVGSLTVLKSHLYQHNITEFKSLNEVMSFQNGYPVLRKQIISKSEMSIENEKDSLIALNEKLAEEVEETELRVKGQLEAEIEYLKATLNLLSTESERNCITKLIGYFRAGSMKRKIKRLEKELPSKIHQSVCQSEHLLQENIKRNEYITTRFQEAVREHCSVELNILDRKKAVIDECNSVIYGAIGEQKVVKELEKLPDDYILINDFRLLLNPPVYNRSENEYIKSAQIDHLLIGPSGLYLIETKNWSEASLNSLNLRSPVAQLRRSSFALFTVMNKYASGFSLEKHHWGKRKVVIKNLLVLINKKPQEEFQYVKVLTLDQLIGYIRYFPPIYTKNETEDMANQLLSLSVF